MNGSVDAMRVKRKERAQEDFIIDKRKGWGSKEYKLMSVVEEGFVYSEIREKEEILGIISVYSGED